MLTAPDGSIAVTSIASGISGVLNVGYRRMVYMYILVKFASIVFVFVICVG